MNTFPPIFDHWRNFEYFDERKKEEEPSRSKSLTEQLFESRIKLGQVAVEKQNLAALKLSIGLIAADIAALPQDCLCVRDKWREIRAMQKDDVIDGFDPATVAALRSQIAPLMQWRDAHGKESALRFDLLVARLQEAKLKGSASADDLRDQVINDVSALPINLKQVAEKNTAIQQAKTTGYYDSASVEDLENLRTELRGIMQFRRKQTRPTLEPLVLNVLFTEVEPAQSTREHSRALRPHVRGRSIGNLSHNENPRSLASHPSHKPPYQSVVTSKQGIHLRAISLPPNEATVL